MLTQTAIKADSPAIEQLGAQRSRHKAGAQAGKAFGALLSSLTDRKSKAASGLDGQAAQARVKAELNAQARLAATERDARTAKRLSADILFDEGAAHVKQAAESAKKSGSAIKKGEAPIAAERSVADADGESRARRKKAGLTQTQDVSPLAQVQGAQKADKPESKAGPDQKALKAEGESSPKPIKVNVTDLRMKAKAAQERAETEAGRSETQTPSASADAKPFQHALPDHGLSAEQVSLPPAASSEPIASPESQALGLAARLREDGASDIVRAAQVVLRDGEMGLIRLRLEPQTLGGVKIELKLTEKLVSGRIVVESDLAAEAFRSSLDALRDAFAEAGFETASLEVEVRGEGQGGSESGGREGGEPYWSAGLRELGKAVPELAQAETQTGLNLIV